MSFRNKYPNTYIDDIRAVDAGRHTSNNGSAPPYVPEDVTRSHNESSNAVYLPTPHGDRSVYRSLSEAQASLAGTKRILETSENHRKELGRSNKALLDQVPILRAELQREKQTSADLQAECTLANHRKREAETQLEQARVNYANLLRELEEEKAINANLGSEINALYERYESTWDMAFVASARNKELEAMLATLYGTPEERAERALRAEEEREAILSLESDLIDESNLRKAVEDENKRLRAVAHFLEKQIQAGAASTREEDKEFKPRPKKLFIKEEEDY